MSAGKLSGKIAVVTASTEGIGYAIARRLAQDGAKVVISSRKQANVDSAVAKLKSENLDVHGLVCHVGKADDRRKLAEETVRKYGGIDILISNAGTNPIFGSSLETTEEVWDKLFDTNLKSAYFLCQEIIPHIEKRGGGSVIFVSSLAAFANNEHLALYGVTKTALVALCKGLTPECATKNIRVNCLAPGVIRTRLSKALWQSPALEEELKSRIPLRRLGEPDECAGIVSFLVSNDASYITGETIVIAGGSPSRL